MITIQGATIPLRFKTLQNRPNQKPVSLPESSVLCWFYSESDVSLQRAGVRMRRLQPPLFFFSASFKQKHQTWRCSLWSAALRASYTVCACLFVHRHVCVCVHHTFEGYFPRGTTITFPPTPVINVVVPGGSMFALKYCAAAAVIGWNDSLSLSVSSWNARRAILWAHL